MPCCAFRQDSTPHVARTTTLGVVGEHPAGRKATAAQERSGALRLGLDGRETRRCFALLAVVLLVGDLVAQPLLGHLEDGRGVARVAQLHVVLVLLEPALPARRAVVVKVVNVGRPRVKAVEDVGCVDDGGIARLGLLLQPHEEVLAHDHVERGGDLVEEEDVERAQEREEELHAPPLSVRDLVHAPVGVDAEDVDQLRAALRVLSLEGLHHLCDGNVGLQRHAVARERDGAHAPVGVEVGAGHVEAHVAEGVLAEHLDRLVGLGQVLAAQDAQERRLARAVGADEEAPRAACQLHVQALDHVLVAVARRVGEVEVGHLDREVVGARLLLDRGLDLGGGGRRDLGARVHDLDPDVRQLDRLVTPVLHPSLLGRAGLHRVRNGGHGDGRWRGERAWCGG
mmetsp:Transcript_36620/g.84660  ORF Transcript_36620/g.84660 Transcript_36620/m.84660 type:complete len:398 (+) Transcript_36620:527-1720(+)